MAGRAGYSNHRGVSWTSTVNPDREMSGAAGIWEKTVADKPVREERSSVLCLQCLQPGQADQARALIARVVVGALGGCPSRALIEIDRLAQRGSHHGTCRDNDRERYEESDTTHRTTPRGLKLLDPFSKYVSTENFQAQHFAATRAAAMTNGRRGNIATVPSQVY